MKVLMMSHYFASHKGGIEIVADNLFRTLTEKGQEITWMASDATPGPESDRRLRSVSLPVFNFVENHFGVPFPIPTPAALKKIVREVDTADVLMLHDCLYLSNIVAFLFATWHKIPTIIIQHTRYFPNDTGFVNAVTKFCTAIVTRPMLSNAAQVIFIGETTKNFFSDVRYRRCPEVIFNGVDTNLFRGLNELETIPALRCEYDLPQDRRVILFVGRFVEKKGISVMKRMVEMRPEWIWAFAGWGPLDPSRWNAENVRVFSALCGPSIAKLYRCCDLLVLPSCGEGGFPLVLREALASGIPVVCGEETQRADPAIGEFARGAMTYVGDADRTAHEFLTAIDASLATPPNVNENSQERRISAVSRCSWQRAAERYLEILSRVFPHGASQGDCG
jgi:glycosyltransferase involved in cell wall biosynthesis